MEPSQQKSGRRTSSKVAPCNDGDSKPKDSKPMSLLEKSKSLIKSGSFLGSSDSDADQGPRNAAKSSSRMFSDTSPQTTNPSPRNSPREMKQKRLSNHSTVNSFRIDLDRKLQQLPLEATKKNLVRFVCFNKEASLLAYGGLGEEISMIWTETWEIIKTIPTGGKLMLYFGEFSADDRWFFYGGKATKVVRLTVPYPENGTDVRLVQKNSDWAQEDLHVGFPLVWGTTSPDSQAVLFGGKTSDACLRVVEIGSWGSKAPLYEVSKPTKIGAFSPKGDCIIYATETNELIRVNWPGTDDADQCPPCMANGLVETLAFAPSGELFAYAGDDKTVTLARTDTLDVIHEIPVSFEMRHVKFSPVGDFLAYGGGDKKITLVSAFTFDVFKEIPLDEEAFATDFTHDGRLLAFGGKDKMVTVSSPDVWHVALHKQTKTIVHQVAFTEFPGTQVDSSTSRGTKSSKQRICAIAEEKYISIWSLGQDGNEWTAITKLGEGKNLGKRAINFSPNGAFLARGGKNQEAVLVRTSDWHDLGSWAMGDDIMTIGFSPDSYYMVCGSRNGKILVVCTVTLETVLDTKSRKDIRCACFTPLTGLNSTSNIEARPDASPRTASKDSRGTSRHESIQVKKRLKVFIKNAENLPKYADYASKIDPLCICQLGDKEVGRTMNIPEGGANPVWNHGPLEIDWDGAESLCFTVVDQDVQFHDYLGCAYLKGDQFFNGFDGPLTLEGREKSCYSRLFVRVEVMIVQKSVLDVPKAFQQVVTPRRDSERTKTEKASQPFWLAVADGGKELSFYDTSIWELEAKHNSGTVVNAFDFSNDGRLLAFGGKDDKITVLRTDLTKEGIDKFNEWPVVFEFDTGSELNNLQFSPVADYLAFGGKDRMMRLAVQGADSRWTMLKTVDLGAEIKALSFSGDGSLLGMGGLDNAVTILDLSASPPESAEEPTIHELEHWIRSKQDARVEHAIEHFPSLLASPATVGQSQGNPALQICIECQQSDLAAQMLEARPLLAYLYFEGGKRAKELAEELSDRIVVEALFRASLKTSQIHPEGVFDMQKLFQLPSFAGLAGDLFDNLQLVSVPCNVTKALFLHDRGIKHEHVQTSRWDSPNRSDLWGSFHSKGGIPVIAKRTVWPGLGKIDLLRVLIDQDDVRIFNSPTMRLVVTTMWENHIRKRFLKKFFLYLSYVVIYSVAARGLNIVDIEEANDLWIQVIVFALAAMMMSFEVFQGIERGIRDYVTDHWNWLDISANMTVMISIFFHFLRKFNVTEMTPDGTKPWNNLEALSTFVGFSNLCVYLNIFQFLRGFDKSAALVQMIGVIVMDMRPFICIMSIVVLGFSNFFYFSLKATSDEVFEDDSFQVFGSFSGAALETVKNGLFGEFESMLEVLLSSRYYGFNITMWVCFMVCTMIVMLNALIAIMGDSYARVTESLYATTLMQRARMIVEFLEVEKDTKRKEIERDTEWIHLLMPKSRQVQMQQADGWTGQLNAMRKEIQKSEDRMTSNLCKQIREVPKEVLRGEQLQSMKKIVKVNTAVSYWQETAGVTNSMASSGQENRQTASDELIVRLTQQMQQVEQRCSQQMSVMCEQMQQLQKSNEQVIGWFGKLRDRKRDRTAQRGQALDDQPQHQGQHSQALQNFDGLAVEGIREVSPHPIQDLS